MNNQCLASPVGDTRTQRGSIPQRTLRKDSPVFHIDVFTRRTVSTTNPAPHEKSHKPSYHLRMVCAHIRTPHACIHTYVSVCDVRLFWLKVRRSLWASALAGKNKLRGGASRSKMDGGKANPQGIKIRQTPPAHFTRWRRNTTLEPTNTFRNTRVTPGPPPGP